MMNDVKVNNNVTTQPVRVTVPECGYYLNTIYFYLTEGCNLKCRHCWIAPKYQTAENVWPHIGFDLFKDIVMQGKELGMSGVKLTGGEPLIHPEIGKIIDFINSEDLRLTVETNGIMCTPGLAARIAKGKNAFVSVSLDGDNPETHEWLRGVPGSFNDAIAGLRNLVAAGIKPQVIMSLMKNNRNQMESVVRLAEKEGVGSVKFNIIMPTARGEKMHADEQTLTIEELVETGDWVENKLIPSSKIKIHHSHPAAFRPLSMIFGSSNGRCGIFGIIGVLGSGKYALCGIGETVPELIFGNAAKDRLKDIWNNNKVLNEIRKGLPENLNGVCGRCLMRKNCLGSCIAMNYSRSHDLFAPYWYCDEAFKAGLFPKTRLQPGK